MTNKIQIGFVTVLQEKPMEILTFHLKNTHVRPFFTKQMNINSST